MHPGGQLLTWFRLGASGAHRLRCAGFIGAAAVNLSCAHTPSDPSREILVDAVISPAFASVGTQVTITLRAFNPGSRVAEWNSGCGMDLGFEILDAQGHVAETPLFGVCTAELRQLRLNPGESMERRINWRLGFTVPASRLPDGRYQVRGLLGLDERGRRPGSVAALEIKR